MILKVNPHNPQKRHIARAVEVLHQGGVIAYPTDTIYGIGCDIFSKSAIQRVRLIKHQKGSTPYSFLCADLKDISQYAHVTDEAYRIMRRLLPGPYTFVLRATKLVPRIMLSRQKTVGLRVPDNEICLALVRDFGNPIVSTSAALPNGKVLNDQEEIEAELGKQLDLVLDGGILGLEPSSVVDLSGEVPVVLRKGKGDVSMFVE